MTPLRKTALFSTPPPAMPALKTLRKPAPLAFALAAIALLCVALLGSPHAAYADEPGATAIAITTSAGTDKMYVTGETITVRVTLPQTIAAVSGASLTVQIGSDARAVSASDCSASCGTTLDFSYTVVAGDHDANGITVAPDALSATSLTHQHGSDPAHAFSLALPDTLASPQGDHRVNLGDYDQDDDGLIEVSTLAHLNAIHWDLDGDGGVSSSDSANYAAAFLSRNADMGCPTNADDADNNDCLGYELDADLDFDTDGDGATVTISGANRQTITGDSGDDYYNSNQGFGRLGNDNSAAARFNAVFKGNGHTISNLFMNSSGTSDYGLFGAIGESGRVESVAILDAFVNGNNYVGILAGTNRGVIHTSYSTGEARGNESLGGLVGINITSGSASAGDVIACYSAARVVGTTHYSTGGLVGTLQGTNANIRASYSIGAVTSSVTTQGVLGNFGVGAPNSNVVATYWDTETTGIADDSGTDMPEGKTTADLSSPTSATGIYADWDDMDLTDDGTANATDDPWDFGYNTYYPILSYGGHDADVQRVSHDADGDGLIEISTLDQLNAVRYDLDGDGNPSAGNDDNYYAPFPNAKTGAGWCPTTDADADDYDCVGYELIADLDFDTDGDGDVDMSDDYPNWTPMGYYVDARFDGNGRTISNLTINSSSSAVGLFQGFTRSAISNLGLLDVDVTTSADSARIGALGGVNNGATLRSVYATGSVSQTGTGASHQAGGILGYSISSNFYACWSGVSVSASGTNMEVGGIVGRTDDDIIASYATGPVSATGANNTVGGLSGSIQTTDITASYSTSPITATGTGTNSGPLYGRAYQANTINASYWDTGTTGIADDANSDMPEGKTTRELQSVTSATGIFADWDDLTVDAVGTNDDDPWDFGGRDEYPVLNFGGLAPEIQRGEARIQADNWDFPVVGEILRVWLPGGPDLRAVKSTTGNGCPAPAATEWKQPWIWQYSTNGGATWTNLADSDSERGANCTYTFIPQSEDAGRHFRAKVELAAGGDAVTAIAGKVQTSSSSATAAALAWSSGHAAPVAGTAITATDIPAGATLSTGWRWQRCDDNTATPAGCEHAGWWTRSYTPGSDDVSHYIRAYIYYQTAAGVWTRGATPFTTAAVTASN